MPDAQARYMPGLAPGWLAHRVDLHVAMVQAWLTDSDLPRDLLPERPPSPEVLARLRRELGEEAVLV